MKPGMPMPPAPDAAAQAPAPAKPSSEGSPVELAGSILDGMMKLSDLVAASPVASPEDKQKIAALAMQTKAFIEEMASPPGAKPQGPSAPGSVPPEVAGAKNARPL